MGEKTKTAQRWEGSRAEMKEDYSIFSTVFSEFSGLFSGDSLLVGSSPYHFLYAAGIAHRGAPHSLILPPPRPPGPLAK
jgi:hypothetical protein